MKRIGLLSDTHGYLHPDIMRHFAACDELWHAGDIGSLELADQLEAFRPLRAVYGNIDGGSLRLRYPENMHFTCEGLKVYMTHIGGYPGKYPARIKKVLASERPGLFICGHSHILKIMPDPGFQLLHINPGACGREGFHKVCTVIRFGVEDGRIKDLEVVELGLRGGIVFGLT